VRASASCAKAPTSTSTRRSASSRCASFLATRSPKPPKRLLPARADAGHLAAVSVSEGANVRRGDLLLRVEALKMEHPVMAPNDGTVTELRVAPGSVVAAGDVPVVIEPA
jgi:biotin carboxyl carrier protein